MRTELAALHAVRGRACVELAAGAATIDERCDLLAAARGHLEAGAACEAAVPRVCGAQLRACAQTAELMMHAEFLDAAGDACPAGAWRTLSGIARSAGEALDEPASSCARSLADDAMGRACEIVAEAHYREARFGPAAAVSAAAAKRRPRFAARAQQLATIAADRRAQVESLDTEAAVARALPAALPLPKLE